MFSLAQGRYDEQIDLAELTECYAYLCIKNRKGDKAHIAKAKDVFDLYLYVTGLTQTFLSGYTIL